MNNTFFSNMERYYVDIILLFDFLVLFCRAGFSDWSGQVDPSNPPTSVTMDYISYEKYDESSGGFVPEWRDDFDSFNSDRWQKADWTFPFAVNNFSPSNVNIEDGNLVINFSR